MKFVPRQFALIALVALLVTLAVPLFRQSLLPLDAWLYDAGLLARPTPKAVKTDIVVLGLDEEFMAGRHPYLTPRDRLATLISVAASGHPKVIAVDVSLDVRLDKTPNGQDAQLRSAFQKAKALGVPVVLTDLGKIGEGSDLWQSSGVNGAMATQRQATDPYFKQVVDSTGTVIITADPDGVNRHLADPPQPGQMPFLPARIAQLATGKAVEFAPRTPFEFWGPPGTNPIVPAVSFIKQPLLVPLLNNKIVFIGATYRLSYDLLDSPYSFRNGQRKFYGVEFLAQATQTLLDNNRPRPFDSASNQLWELVLVFIVAYAAIALSRWGVWQGLAFGFISLGGALLLALWTARDAAHLALLGYHYHPASPFVIAIPLATSLGLAWRQWVQAQELRMVRDSFSAYVGDEILTELGGKMPELGGEVRPIAVLFCDIRGYSALAETMRDDPKGLLNELNGHFHPLVNALKERGAYVDNYVGDLVMALFNAPVNRGGLEQAAQKAVLAALDFVQVVEERNAARRAEGKPAIEIGVGVHCGDAVVGNLGSLEEGGRSKIHYTAIGDTVNIASRVESSTRKYDATLLVTEETVHACGDQFGGKHFHWEFIAETTVKGRIAPVRLYKAHPESL